MKKALIPAVAVLGVLAAGTTGASAQKAANIQACVLLPDTKSSVRWETQDRRYLAAAFKAAGVTHTIVNAENDAQRAALPGRPVPDATARRCCCW